MFFQLIGLNLYQSINNSIMSQSIIISLGSELVFCGTREPSIINNFLSFEDNRSIYWQYSKQLLKIRIGSGEEEVIEYGYYSDGRTKGENVHFKLIS